MNDTPFSCAPLNGRLNFPGHSLTFIVKGTFDLRADAHAVAAEEQLFPTGDEYYADDEEMRGTPRYPSDFAYFKPRADLLLTGTCHAPSGAAVARCRVVFQVGERRNMLGVFGNRTWQHVEPEPFTQMPLRYENSFGGSGYGKNPVGKGIDPSTGPDGRPVIALPNIENIATLLRTPDQRPEPAGFAPLNQTWAQRYSKLGSYDGNYLEERWPWFAQDFDWGFFNAAPPEMQVDGYLKGDEPLYLENLHPQYAQLRSALPGLRIRCFVVRTESAAEVAGFHELPMRLDTLWVDADALKLVLVWRGPIKVASEESEEIEHVFVAAERLSDPAQSVEHYRDLFTRRLADIRQEEEMEPEEPPTADEEETAPADSAEVELELARAEADLRAQLSAAGIDPNYLPPPRDKETLEREAELLKDLDFEDEPESQPASRKTIEARAAAGESLAEEDFSGLDLTGLTLEGVDLSDANFTDSILVGARLARSNLRGANIAGGDLRNADLRDADLTESDFSRCRLIGANLGGARLVGASFEDADLTGAVLTEVVAGNALFTGADLTEVMAGGAAFDGADFSNATLHRSNLRACSLREASFEGAEGQSVDMSGADLAELRAANCRFSYGLFIQVAGADSIWQEAMLNGADFRYSNLEGADFTASFLNGADLLASNMKLARLVKARLSDARLAQTNLFQANLEKADLTGANLSGSNLYGAETLDAKIASTTLTGANLKMTKLALAAKDRHG